jgi:hypothetical protein
MLPSFGWTSLSQHGGYFYPKLFSPGTPASTFPSAVCSKLVQFTWYTHYDASSFEKSSQPVYKFPDPNMKLPAFEIAEPFVLKIKLFLPSDRSWLGILSNIFAIGRLIIKFAFRLPANFPFLASGSTCRLAFVTFPGSSRHKTHAPSSLAVRFRNILSWILLLVEGGID